mgnify:CR=1 FL=1
MQNIFILQSYFERYRSLIFLIGFFFIGLMVGYIIHSDHLVIFVNLLAVCLYFAISKNIRISLLLLAGLFPLAFGDLGPVEEFLWVEWMAPLFLVTVLYSVITEQSRFVFRGANIFIIALAILVLAAIINYIKNPVTSHELFGAGEGASGIRSYYTIFIGVLLFFIAYWLLLNDYVNFHVLFGVLILVALAAGILRVFSYFLEFDTPLLYSEFHYAPPPTEYGGSIAHRIGGLDRVTRIGLPAVIAFYHNRRWNMGAVLLVVAFFILMFLGGGRSIFLGVVFAAAVYFVLLHKQRIGFLLILAGLIFVIYLAASAFLPVPDQFNRIFAYQGGIIQQSLPRGFLFKFYIDSFLSSPIMGKGIGFTEVGVHGDYLSQFVTTNLMIGGHGAYLSIISIFGLCGAFNLVVFLFGGILYHLRFLKNASPALQRYQDLSLFILLSLLIKTATYVVGWSGFNDLALYLFAGLTAALFTKSRLEQEPTIEREAD